MRKINRSLIILLLVLTVGLVGLTIAYFSNSSTITNEFKTNPYGTTVEENFVAPSNWLPGDVTNKTIMATNTGAVDEAVRISYEESWTPNKSGSTLSGWIHPDGSKSNHTTQTELDTDERVAIINFVNPSDWTYENGYYYYNYRIEPGESTTSLIESVTFNPHTKLDDTCVTEVEGNVKTITCDSSGSDYDNAHYTLTFTVETVQFDKYASAWNLPQNTSIAIEEEKPEPVVEVTGAEKLATTATNASGTLYDKDNLDTKSKMFTFTHTIDNQTVNESRYIGNAPNNYVYFNCTDDSDTSTCEKWRILGTFDVERTDPTDTSKTITETRMKLVRGDILENRAFNSSYNNDWTAAPLNTYLNVDYYNGTVTNGLTASARNKIDKAKYYLGAISYDSTNKYGTTEKIYGEERGNTICDACSGNSDKLTWEGNVGLMYPSDMYMVYGNGVDSNCYTDPYNCDSSAGRTNGWVYNTNTLNGGSLANTWLLSSLAGYSVNVLYGYSDAGLGNDRSGGYGRGVRPVVYLKSDIKIAGGNGEEETPYELE